LILSLIMNFVKKTWDLGVDL